MKKEHLGSDLDDFLREEDLLEASEATPEKQDMVKETTPQETGEPVTATLPREMAERLHIGLGDQVFAVGTETGVLLTPVMQEPIRTMEVVRSVRDAHYERLKDLSPEGKIVFFREKARTLHNELGSPEAVLSASDGVEALSGDPRRAHSSQ